MKKRYRITKLGYFVFSSLAILLVLLATSLPSMIASDPKTAEEQTSKLATNKEDASLENNATTGTVAANTTSSDENPVASEANEADLKAVRDKELRDMQLSIFFEPNKYDVNSNYYKSLDSFVYLALKYPEVVLLIEGNYNGYPGNRTSEFWTKLAYNRAEVVSAYFVAHGVPQEQMKLVNNGCSKMINKDDSLAELGKNRRVDLSFILK